MMKAATKARCHIAIPPVEGKWEPIPELTDEFDKDRLDASKWLNPDPGWQGRPPGFFAKHNVAVRGGKLHLTSRAVDLPGLPPQYHTFTTASVLSKAVVKYGYFEIKARPMRSRASSAFWFYRGDKRAWTEIDVFEISAGTPGRKRMVYVNAHVFHAPGVKAHQEFGSKWKAPFVLADSFQRYAVDWDENRIKWFVNDTLVHEISNQHWHYPLNMAFDSETFTDWFGLPDPGELPASFSIDYVRAWRRVGRGKHLSAGRRTSRKV